MASNAVIQPVVLSVDDDENAQILLKRAFNKTGIKAALATAKDGHEAIRYLSGEGEFADGEIYPRPTLVLLDLKMPRVTGFDVLQFIRTRPLLQTLPVILFSSSGHKSDVQKAYELGCHSYVVKPTDFEKLIQMVRAIETEFFGGGGERTFSRFVVPNETIPMVVENPKSQDKRENTSETPDAMFKLLVEQVKDYAVFMLDTEGYIRSWNEGAKRIKGYLPHEIIGKHFSTFYPAQDKESDKPGFELRLAKEMGRYEEEGWRIRKDGSRFWANVLITPLRTPDGKLSGFAKVTRDLTQRKFQEENLQKLLESEERFRLLVEQVKDYAIFILDAKGNVASWNQGARRLKGYHADEIIGKHFSSFYSAEDIASDKPARELLIAIRDGRYEEEGWRIRKDGSRFWASVVITTLWDKRGNLSGFAKVTRDLTDKKREADALRQKTEELEAFAHTLSHDLRAPLRSIKSFAQLLNNEAEELSESEKRDYLAKISNSAQTMDNLITDILKLSQVSLTPAPDQPVSLHEVLAETLVLLEAEIKETGAQVEIKPPLPDVQANRTLLIQIFSNLIGNALKFFPDDHKPKVQIYALKNNGDCEIHVKDCGVGVPEEFQESIFKMFDRGEVENDFSGTGLGLAIVKKAVERLGGTVEVQSQKGAGSDFIVTLNCPSFSPAMALTADT